jgi:hypothetical protein
LRKLLLGVLFFVKLNTKMHKRCLIVPNLMPGMQVKKRGSDQTPGWSGQALHNAADGSQATTIGITVLGTMHRWI